VREPSADLVFQDPELVDEEVVLALSEYANEAVIE